MFGQDFPPKFQPIQSKTLSVSSPFQYNDWKVDSKKLDFYKNNDRSEYEQIIELSKEKSEQISSNFINQFDNIYTDWLDKCMITPCVRISQCGSKY